MIGLPAGTKVWLAAGTIDMHVGAAGTWVLCLKEEGYTVQEFNMQTLRCVYMAKSGIMECISASHSMPWISGANVAGAFIGHKAGFKPAVQVAHSSESN